MTNKHFHISIHSKSISASMPASFPFSHLFSFSFSLSISFSTRSLHEIDIALKVFIAFCSRFHTDVSKLRIRNPILTEMTCQNHQHFIFHTRNVSHGIDSETFILWLLFKNHHRVETSVKNHFLA